MESTLVLYDFEVKFEELLEEALAGLSSDHFVMFLDYIDKSIPDYEKLGRVRNV